MDLAQCLQENEHHPSKSSTIVLKWNGMEQNMSFTSNGDSPSDGKIVRMPGKGQFMSNPILKDLHSYWETLRAGRIAPYRAEIDPRQFESALESMFILERVSQETARLRLAGMRLCNLMDMEVRGMPLRTFMVPGDRENVDTVLKNVMDMPVVAHLELESLDNDHRRSRAQMLLMPLRSDFGQINRVLGCLVDEQEFYSAPVHYSILTTQLTPIETRDMASENTELPGFAEPAEVFDPKPRPAFKAIEGNRSASSKNRDRSHLRLVKDS
jgi:hypothetical protein